MAAAGIWVHGTVATRKATERRPRAPSNTDPSDRRCCCRALLLPRSGPSWPELAQAPRRPFAFAFAFGRCQLAGGDDAPTDQDAEASYREALRLDPAYAEAMYNLANLCRDGGRFDEAIELYDAALRQQEDMLLARRNRGLALLEIGRFAEGWSEYDWRWSEQQRACMYCT